jgi:predicted amidohydrolase YtcJ
MGRRSSRAGIVLLAIAALVPGACSSPPPTGSPTTTSPGTLPPPTSPVGTTQAPGGGWAHPQTLYHGGVILTMQEAMPEAEALLVEGDRIVAVGALDDMRAVAAPSVREVDLGGWLLLPGFIDSHSHRITQRFKWGLDSELEASLVALSEGWTGIDELAVNPEELDALVEAGRRGDLLVRVNAYLAVNPFAGGEVDDWYTDYRPGQVLSPNLRVAGLKIFIDFDSGRTLLWEPDELAGFVTQRHAEGWQVSMKAIGRASHGLALQALEHALGSDSNEEHRHRLEHSLAVTDGQMDTMARLGIIAAIQPGFPGVVWYEDDIRDLVGEEGVEVMFRWPEYLAAGVPAAASPYNPDPRYPEFVDASHVSPMGVLYRAVTQIGLGGIPPEPWMLDRALTVEQLLPLLTIAGAYAAAVEDGRGSLAVGKLADFVVLDSDPRSVAPESLMDIRLQMTVVGGVVRYLRAGAEHLVPGPVAHQPPPPDVVDIAATAEVTASSELPGNPVSNVVDGTPAHWNASDLAPQWVEFRFSDPVDVVAITLEVAQDPSGHSVHELWIGRLGNPLELVHLFEGVTSDGDVLTYQPDAAIGGVEVVRVITTSLGDLYPAWREIEILGRRR